MSEPTAIPGQGFVYIVGAGPGPADLMTLRALNRLQRAEVVVHDRLITQEVLDQIPASAERLYVGKALGNHAVPQDQINALLVQHAQAGRQVVRLKGGDPFVFGRGVKRCRRCRPQASALRWCMTG